MKKDVINSLIIGLLATYLPMLDISGAAERLTGMLAIGVVAFGLMLRSENKNEPQGGTP